MKFYIKNLGCKTNAIEAQIMAEGLLRAGFERANFVSEADIYIINSCTVTAHSDNQLLYLIKQTRAENKNAKVILTGCSAQTLDKSAFKGVDLILGNDEKLDIEKYIGQILEGSKESSGDGACDQIKEKVFARNIFEVKKFKNKFLYKTTQTRPNVKIQDGCNNRCSYCLIPFARGVSRSNSIENIIKQINLHTKNGRKEIVLTGIHIGLFGIDTDESLIDLLKKIEKTDILRFRLGSLYVNEISDELFDFLAQSKKFCPHFHLSLQSMNDKILKAMNRHYTVNEAIKMIEKIQNAFDLPFLGCDIISGFPTENEEDFKLTKERLIEAQLSYIHAFPYSVRKGTKAETMEGQVQEDIKHRRTKELIEVSDNLHKNFLEKNKNTIRTVLYEKKGKNGLFSGVTENYIKVYKESKVNLQNSFEVVKLSDFDELY